jgi:signal transduction histidine kinase
LLDVSERNRAVRELQALNATLEQRVSERTAALVRSVERLEKEVTERQRAERALEESNRELHARTEQLRRLARELNQTEQRERRRLAQMLHDHLQQLLVAARMRAGLVHENASSEVTLADAAKIEEALNEAVVLCRSLTVELSPPVLHGGSLRQALIWLGHWMEENHGLAVKVLARCGPVPVPEDVATLLFQTTRELLFNVVKHSGTKAAQVTFTTQGGGVRVVVSDRGVGFKPGDAHAGDDGGGFGLFGVRERLQLAGGQVVVESRPGRGTRVTLQVPGAPAAATAASVRPRRPKAGRRLHS